KVKHADVKPDTRRRHDGEAVVVFVPAEARRRDDFDTDPALGPPSVDDPLQALDFLVETAPVKGERRLGGGGQSGTKPREEQESGQQKPGAFQFSESGASHRFCPLRARGPDEPRSAVPGCSLDAPTTQAPL